MPRSFVILFLRQVEKLEANGLGSKENLSEESKSSSTNSLDKITSSCTTPTSVTSPVSVTSSTDGGVRTQIVIIHLFIKNGIIG